MNAALINPAPAYPERSSGLATGSISGFGTLVSNERELRALIHRDASDIEDQQKPELMRVLRDHEGRVDAIIGLIEKRQYELPEAARFQALRGPIALQTHARSASQAVRSGMLPELIAFQLRLVGAIEALINSGKRSPNGEPLLRDAARHHTGMAGMLSSLLREDRRELLPAGLASAGTATPDRRRESGARHSASNEGPDNPGRPAISMSRYIIAGLGLSLLALLLNLAVTWSGLGTLAAGLFGFTMILALLGSINDSDKSAL